MFCLCNSELISTREYFKDNNLHSLRSFNFMLVFECALVLIECRIALQNI